MESNDDLGSGTRDVEGDDIEENAKYRKIGELLVDIPRALPKKAYSLVKNKGFPVYWDSDKIKTLHGESIALSIECPSEKHRNTKILHKLNKLHLLAAFAVLVVIAVWKYSSEDTFVRSDKLLIMNLSIGGVVGIVYVFFGTLFLARVIGTFQSKHHVWDRRRKRVCILATIDLVAGIVALSCFLASNSISIIHGCGWLLGSVRVLTIIRTAAFGVILANQMLLVVVAMPVQVLLKIADGLKIRQCIENSKAFQDVIHGVDLPFWVYFCIFAIVYLPYLILLVCTSLALTGPLGGAYCTSIYDTTCYPGADPTIDCHEWQYDCALSTASRALSITLSVYAVLVLMVYFGTLVYTFTVLRTLPYELYRTNHTELGFQLQTRLYTTVLFFISVLVLWMIDNASCNSAVILLLGYLPIEMSTSHLVWTSIAVRLPHYLTEEEFQAIRWDQSFVWQEKDVGESEAKKPSGTEKSTFCFETALKAFYYSYLVYDIEEVPDSSFNIETALQLHSLSDYRVIWHKELDAKCILAWCVESKKIVIAIRGTASKQNFLSDIKVWRSAHPPQRGHYWLGTMPMIHSGFEEFWYTSGLHDDVIHMLDDIILQGSGNERDAWSIWCYGHSLGGAAAKLATLDIQKHVSSQYSHHSFDVSCVTFGCPYVGNKAFASDYMENVNRSWDIFHPNDAVSTSGKMFSLYRRCSQICLVSRFGDVILNPSKLERATLHRFHTKSVTEHLLSTYAMSFKSIVDKYMAIGDETSTSGLRDLLESNDTIRSIIESIHQDM